MKFVMLAAVAVVCGSMCAPGAMAAERGGRGEATHECMQAWKEAHIPAYKEEVRSRMQAWKAANPKASSEARHDEMHQLVAAEREKVMPQVQAARQSCHSGR